MWLDDDVFDFLPDDDDDDDDREEDEEVDVFLELLVVLDLEPVVNTAILYTLMYNTD